MVVDLRHTSALGPIREEIVAAPALALVPVRVTAEKITAEVTADVNARDL